MKEEWIRTQNESNPHTDKINSNLLFVYIDFFKIISAKASRVTVLNNSDAILERIGKECVNRLSKRKSNREGLFRDRRCPRAMTIIKKTFRKEITARKSVDGNFSRDVKSKSSNSYAEIDEMKINSPYDNMRDKWMGKY